METVCGWGKKAKARGRVNAAARKVVVPAHVTNKGDLEVADLPSGSDVAAAVRDLKAEPDVEFAEPNYIYRH